MGKRFKLRLARVIPTFQSCRSKDPSNLPSTPSPFFMLSPVNPKSIDIDFPPPPPPPTTPPKPHHSSLTRHVSSAIISVGCGCRSKSSVHYVSSSEHTESSSAEFRWKKEEKFHVVAKISENNTNAHTHRQKIDSSSVSGESGTDAGEYTPVKIVKQKKKKPKNSNRKKKLKQRVRFSTSSAESGLFSSGHEDDEEEMETLVTSSSRTFSTDSSTDFDPHLETISESPKRQKKNKDRMRRKRKVKRISANKTTTTSHLCPESESPARLSVFQKLMACKVEGKVKESFAIVKKSEDPFEDFKRSMLEMILEKQMFEVGELEELLHCFLSLNSRNHHGVIVEAFCEIWEDLFCDSKTNRCG